MRPGNILKIGFLSFLVIFTGVFAYFKTHDLLLGTSILIETPKDGQTLNEPFLVIRGKAPGSNFLSINGARVLTDAAGSFEKELLLGIGYNVIEIKTLDRFNRQQKKILQLVYKPITKLAWLENQK